MLRISSFNKYEEIIRLGYQRFFNEAKFAALEVSDFLVCQQGGFIDWGGYPCIGLGEVGINNLQKVNIIDNIGASILASDDDYFKTNGNQFFHGVSEFEKGIIKVCNLYLDIWENEWFLRNLAEVIKVANGDHYDWNLDLSKIKDTGKGNFIRNEIIAKLNKYPYLQDIVRIGYNSNLRNAIGHSQFHIVQGGIWLDTYGRNKYATVQGFSFEEWERIVIYGWLIFRYLFSTLRQMTTAFFTETAKKTIMGGIPILVPTNDSKWTYQYIYPDSTGLTWRFVKVNQ